MALLGLELPPRDTVRWSPHRKAAVVNGVRSGAISLGEACERYQLSADEFLAWQQAVEGDGVGALRVTRLQYYRALRLLRPSSVRTAASGDPGTTQSRLQPR
jgi:Protein of unknown function (DUF1153)